LKINKSILKVLVYFGVFSYPVTESEIQFFLDQPIGKTELQEALAQLVKHHFIFRLGEFYSLRNDPLLAERRIKGNNRAQSQLVIAGRIGRFLFRFPYVRGIGISGSLSKNFADENSDFDFFIIAKANRLWIARTIMHLFKKLTYLRKRQHRYCMNYYIDEEAFEIEEKNIFTATELITLLPVSGPEVMDRFFKSNNWAGGYFHQYDKRMMLSPAAGGKNRIKKTVEWIFQNPLGDWLDNYFMKLTTRRWKQKEEKQVLNIKGNRMGLRTGKHFSKPNPVFFQEKVLALYQNNLSEMDRYWNETHVDKNQVFFFKEMM
jgi:hypothetical protein